MDTNDKAEDALLKVKPLALERNICFSAPTMPNCRYDLIVDCGERLVRAQVKYANGKSTNQVAVFILIYEKSRAATNAASCVIRSKK